MVMQRKRDTRSSESEAVEDMPQGKARDMDDIDEMLDAIEEVLESPEQVGIERLSFKEKLRSLSFGSHRYRDTKPCKDMVWVPRSWADSHGLTPYDGPPCIDC